MSKNATRIIASLSVVLGGLALGLMGLMTVADVFMRYVFLSPLPGTSEHTQILMSVLVFCGLILVTREGTHIVVSLFEAPLNRIAPKLYDRIYVAANGVGLVFITYVLWVATIEMYEFQEETLVMEYPVVYLGAFILVLLVLAILQLRHLSIHGPTGHAGEDQDRT